MQNINRVAARSGPEIHPAGFAGKLVLGPAQVIPAVPGGGSEMLMISISNLSSINITACSY